MTKQLIVLIATLGLITSSISCTSTSSDSDISTESEDIASLDAGSEGGDDLLMGSEASEDELGSGDGSDSPITDTSDSGSSEDSVASNDEALETVTEVLPGEAEESLPTMDSAANSESAATLGEVPAPVEDAQTNWDSKSSENEVALSETTTTTEYSTGSNEQPQSDVSAPKVGLQKMAATPWKQGKTNYNTLYFVKPGDSLSSISQMIYGSDRTNELLKGNPTYKTREVRPGDKVYYQSPNRPTDDSKIITYYEDVGLQPEIYVAQSDEKLRDVASNILGYKDGWKELWSINDIESKTQISAGTQLRFWKGSSAATNLAQNSMPSQPAASQPSETASAPATPPPQEVPPAIPEETNMPDPMAMAGSESPSPSDLDSQLGMSNTEMPAQGSMDMPPPPPPPIEMAPPPPPPPVAAQAPPAVEETFEEEAPAMDSEMMMALGVIGAAAALLAGLMVIRKKKQREMEQALNETQVG